MNKRRRYKGKRQRRWAKAFAKIDAFRNGGPKACSPRARREAVIYLEQHRPGGTQREWR